MKVNKPMKVPVLCKVVETARRPVFHVAAMVAFPLSSPRALVDEIAFWQTVTPELGAAVLDEGASKARGEVLVCGACFAPKGQPVPASYVRVRVGSVDKRLSVLGDRYWRGGVPTQPEPFVAMPIDWSHALGGKSWGGNPYGKGIDEVPITDPALKARLGPKAQPLPNVEVFGALLRSPAERPPPASFLPMDVTFSERRARAGTFGRDYADKWAPGLPPDCDPEFFNVAPSDQRVEGFFKGDEPFLVENMSPRTARQEGALPGLVARAFIAISRAGQESFEELSLRCDTVWLWPSIDLGAVIFHGSVPVVDAEGADVRHLLVACEELGRPRPFEHYRAARLRRLDKDKGAIADLSDSDLMPDRESGVVANASFGEMGQWVRSEGLALARSERARKRMFEQARAKMAEAGEDPSLLVEPAPAPVPPPVDDLDAVARYLEEQQDRIEAQKREAEGTRERVAEHMQRASDALGVDVAEQVQAGSDAVGGPPRFSAAAVRRSMLEICAEARATGTPALAMEAQLEDEAFLAELVERERALVYAYRRGAHVMPPAAPMPPESAQLARVLVETAREAGEGLAERDLTGADLRGLDLRTVELTRALLEGADLRDAELTESALGEAVLARADLRGAKLAGAKLSGANLGGADLRGAALDGADLRRAVVSKAKLDGASLRGVDLTEADLTEVDWGGVDLSAALLDGAVLVKARLVGARLTGVRATRATFYECVLDGADFAGAHLEGATFVRCTASKASFASARLAGAVMILDGALTDCDFREANLEKACLRTTTLRGSSFDRARMTFADLSECDASRATFRQASMRNATLLGTKLEGASFRGANLQDALLGKSKMAGADFTGAQLCRADLMRAVGDEKTTFAEASVEFTRFDRDGARRGA